MEKNKIMQEIEISFFNGGWMAREWCVGLLFVGSFF